MDEAVVEFLRESNNIEDVWDDDSLAQAIYAWNFLISQKKLTPGVVLETHKILMLHTDLQPDEKGYFRKAPVWIGGHEAKPWMLIPSLVNQWLLEANERSKTWGDIKGNHCFYESIHPFIDGNGRTGRMFMNWIRLKVKLPILIIKEKERGKYYRWFD